MKYYNKLIKKWNFVNEVAWQKAALLNTNLRDHAKAVIAAGTSSGKTYYMIMRLILQYWDKNFKGKRTLILPAAQSNLRLNFLTSLLEFTKVCPVPFTFKPCYSGSEVRAALNSNVDVIIALPQSVGNLKKLPHIHQLILDEAHQWYFAPTLKRIIKKTKPKLQVLLTGTPFRFTREGGFMMYFVPVMELFNEGLITNVETQIVSSSYNFSNDSYTNSDELKGNTKLHNTDSLEKVILEAVKRLQNPLKGLKNVNRFTHNVAAKFFNHLDKTVIWCRNISQAKFFAKTLRSYKGLENAIYLSTSKNDVSSENLEKFKDDPSARVLVVVDRTKLGWSYRELFNAIDFTMTRNPATILQMLARLFRLSILNPKKQKIFYKVASSHDAGYVSVLMKAVLLLLNRPWYTQFNGKNFDGIQIPMSVNKCKKDKKKPSKPSKNKTRKVSNFTPLDIPLDLNFYKTVYYRQDDLFSTTHWCTIRDVKEELLGKDYSRIDTLSTSDEEMISKLKNYKLRYDFMRETEKDSSKFALYSILGSRGIRDKAFAHMLDYQLDVRKRNKDVEFFIKLLKQYKGKTLRYIHENFKPLYTDENGLDKYGGRWLVYTCKKLEIDIYKTIERVDPNKIKREYKLKKFEKMGLRFTEIIDTISNYEYLREFRLNNKNDYTFCMKHMRNELSKLSLGSKFEEIGYKMTQAIDKVSKYKYLKDFRLEQTPHYNFLKKFYREELTKLIHLNGGHSHFTLSNKSN
jgi:hypothetical protein